MVYGLGAMAAVWVYYFCWFVGGKERRREIGTNIEGEGKEGENGKKWLPFECIITVGLWEGKGEKERER